MYRIASRTVADYWFSHYSYNSGLDCKHCSKAQRQKCKEDNLYSQCAKAIKMESLNKPIIDSEGHTTELGELIADDKSLDLGTWLDAKTFKLTFPQRLLLIADKLNGFVQLGSSSTEIEGGQVAELMPQLLDRLIALGDMARQISNAIGSNCHREDTTAELSKELSDVTK
ncbi:hypothetical protein ACFLUS_03215 [Chloroflexota bacterium]